MSDLLRGEGYIYFSQKYMNKRDLLHNGAVAGGGGGGSGD